MSKTVSLMKEKILLHVKIVFGGELFMVTTALGTNGIFFSFISACPLSIVFINNTDNLIVRGSLEG